MSMVNNIELRIGDKEKLQLLLGERGLPIKLEAKLTNTERKIHEVLCATYNFTQAQAGLELPRNVLQRTGAEFEKIWQYEITQYVGQGKVEAVFKLTPAAIKQTIKTGLRKDAGIFRSKSNPVELHVSWSKYFRPKPQASDQPIDWSKTERLAKRSYEANKQNINDGKTFNAQKDNPWARKHLKNKGQ